MKKFFIVSMLIAAFTITNGFCQTSVHISSDCQVSATEADISVGGDWMNQGALDFQDTRLIMNGTDDQNLAHPAGSALTHLVVDKPDGFLYLIDTLTLSDSLTLRDGKMFTADSALLILLSRAGCSPSDSTSFVDGPMAKVYPAATMADSLIFPTGCENDYRPVTVYLASVTGDSVMFKVNQINASAVKLGGIPDGLDKVSHVRYWYVSREGPGTPGDIHLTFSYDTLATNDGVEIASELRVALMDTGDVWTWNAVGGPGTEDYAGTIRTEALNETKLGYFTFGDALGGGDISLPVLLSLFELAEQRGSVILSWKTESEVNNAYWLVQRRVEGDSSTTFETIMKQEGQGTKSTATEYAVTDASVVPGTSYAYRLTDVSVSGRRHHHDPVSIVLGIPNRYQLYQNYPNPFNPATTILYDVSARSDVRLDVYNIAGQKVATLVKELQKPGYYKLVWDGKNRRGNQVASGFYILRMEARTVQDEDPDNFSKVRKMVLIR